jgi:hypothetical protein
MVKRVAADHNGIDMAYVLITNDLDPYFRDVVTLLALPYGAQHRFRYERSEGVDFVGNLQAKAMAGRNGLIVFRQRSSGRLAPIRRIRIDRVFSSSHLLVIEFSVLAFPDLNLAAAAQLEHAVGAKAVENVPGGVFHPLVIELSDSTIDGIIGPAAGPKSDSESYDCWRTIIHSVADFGSMASSCFLYAHIIYEDQVALPWTRIRDGALAVDTQGVYEVQVASYVLPSADRQGSDTHDSVKQFGLTLKCDSAVISVVKDASTVVSRYDNHRFAFRAKPGIEGVGTNVIIAPAVESTGLFVPTITLPVYGRFAGWQWFSLIAGAAFYAVSFALPDVWQKIAQGLGVILVAIFGKDSSAALARILWNSAAVRALRQAWGEMSK